MHRHHRLALLVILGAAILDTACGLAFAAAEHLPAGYGLYWAVATATTVGYGDVAPKTVAGHVIAVVTMLSVIPLFAASFSLLTSGLTGGQVSGAEDRIKQRIERKDSAGDR